MKVHYWEVGWLRPAYASAHIHNVLATTLNICFWNICLNISGLVIKHVKSWMLLLVAKSLVSLVNMLNQFKAFASCELF